MRNIVSFPTWGVGGGTPLAWPSDRYCALIKLLPGWFFRWVCGMTSLDSMLGFGIALVGTFVIDVVGTVGWFAPLIIDGFPLGHLQS